MPDVVVVGAGFGGMAAALRLRAHGFSVEVFDNNSQAGGRAGTHLVHGYQFDAGPTVITAPFLFDELWQLFGKSREQDVEFRKLMPWYRIYFADARQFDYGGNTEQLLQHVQDFAPGDLDGYRKLLVAVRKIYEVGFEQLGTRPFESFKDMLRVLPDMIRLRSDRSVYSFVSRYIKDEALRRVFSFQPLLVGGNPFHTTSIYSLIQHLERKDGVSFAIGGTGALVAALVKLMHDEGIVLHLNSRVCELDIVKGRAVGIRLEDGRHVKAGIVVANADAPALYRNLIAANWRKKWSNPRIRRKKFSMGLFVLYMGVRRQYPELAHHSILLGRDYKELLTRIFDDRLLTEDLSLYLHAPTRTDSSMAPPGCESLYALVPVPNLEPVPGRPPIDWRSAGAHLQEQVLNLLESTVCPGLREHLEVSFYVTPEHFRDNLHTEHGTGFSIQPTLLQSASFRFHNRSEDVSGLYLVGAGTHPGAGLPGVLCSAKILEHYIPEMRSRIQENVSGRGAA